ncbi:MAG: hypothetical protein AAB953_00640 [Patescibacteria group bacterium]
MKPRKFISGLLFCALVFSMAMSSSVSAKLMYNAAIFGDVSTGDK